MASKIPSLDELLESVSKKSLDKPCSDEHIVEIASKVTNWRLIAPHLGLTEVDEENIVQNHRDVQLQRREMLRTWQQKFGFRATYGSLARALHKAERVDLVEKVIELLTEKVVEVLTGEAAATSSLKLGTSSPGEHISTSSNSTVNS